jgi:hypothetical protein
MKSLTLFSEITYSINGFSYDRTCRKCNLIMSLMKLDEIIGKYNNAGFIGNSIMNVDISKIKK